MSCYLAIWILFTVFFKSMKISSLLDLTTIRFASGVYTFEAISIIHTGESVFHIFRGLNYFASCCALHLILWDKKFYKEIVSLDKRSLSRFHYLLLDDGRVATKLYQMIDIGDSIFVPVSHILTGYASEVSTMVNFRENRLISGGSNGEMRIWDLLELVCLL